MKRAPRAVVSVTVRGHIARLYQVDTGAEFLDLVAAAEFANVEAHPQKGGIIVGLSRLPDVEAALEHLHPRAIVQRRKP